jgi:hypothetical protein
MEGDEVAADLRAITKVPLFEQSAEFVAFITFPAVAHQYTPWCFTPPSWKKGIQLPGFDNCRVRRDEFPLPYSGKRAAYIVN